MLNEDLDDMFCEIEDPGFNNSKQDWHSPEEMENDVEVFFMMMLGLG